MSAHNITVNVYDFNEELVAVPLVTLATWAHGLKLEHILGESGRVTKTVKRYLSCPKNYPQADLSAHITESYRDAKEQLGL